MRTTRSLTATVALAAMVAFTSSPATATATADDVQATADGSATLRSELQAQVEANDLSSAQALSLQVQVDQVVDRTGGTQVAINQVVWDGGDTLVPLPGETRARELGAAASAADDACHNLQFCTYRNRNYTGIVDRVSSCVLHHSHRVFTSYINRQTRGTRARFYDSFVRPTTWTKPAPDRGTTSLGDAENAMYINPCPPQ